VTNLLPFLITGLVTGAIYGLAGLGLVLTYRTSGIVNLGHGAIAAAAAYAFYSLWTIYGVPWPIAATIVIVAFAVIGGPVLERITRALAGANAALSVVATVGILLAVEGALLLLYGDPTRSGHQFLPTSGFIVSGVTIQWGQVITFVIAAAASLGLYAMLQRSRTGTGMRAVVDNPTLVGLSGDRASRIRTRAWAIGCAFAALSGILLSPTLNLDANLLTLVVIQAFGACAVGAFTSLPLTFAGGLLVGVLGSLAGRYFTRPPLSGLYTSAPYVVLIVVLLIVPARRLPQPRAALQSLAGLQRSVTPRVTVVGTVLVGGFLLLVPTFVGTRLPDWISAMCYVTIFGSLALLVWVSGQISLCHMAFAAVGATTFAKLTTEQHVPWGIALLLAGLLTMPVGALVAIPAIRLSGVYLAVLTLGFGILMQNVVFPSSLMFGQGIFVAGPRPSLGPLHGASDDWFYYVVLAVAAVTALVVIGVLRSRLGRLLRALAESPTLLAVNGLGVNTTRLIVFCVSAFIAGVGGALLLAQAGSVSGVGFGPVQSMLLVAVLAVCGTRPLRSAVLAAGLLAVLPAYVTRFGVDQQTFGFGVVALAASVVVAKRDALLSWFKVAARTSTDRRLDGPARARGRDQVEVGAS
jgi:branched-subunit amino acid ABC-type transport system permease component